MGKEVHIPNLEDMNHCAIYQILKKVKCNKKDIDRYKRIVAECFVGQTNLNKELVRNGWALAYRDYSKDYIIDEEFAQENNLGLWKGTFIHPKKWRKQNR